LNSLSTTTSPPIRYPVWVAMTVMVGSSELRRTCRRITVVRGSPLSTAVRV
jgi:hypothetical protein